MDISDNVPDGEGWWIFQGSRHKIMRRIGIGATLLMAAIPYVASTINGIRLRRAKRDEEERLTESRDTVLTLVLPLNGHIARLAELQADDADGHANILGQATATALGEVCNFFGGAAAHVRVCFWKLDDPGEPRVLVPTEHHGAGRLAACKISENDGCIGERFFDALDHRRPIEWNSGNLSEHPAGWSPGEHHRAFVAVAVGSQETLYGMITLNAAIPSAFARTQDLRIIQLVAEQYATFLSVHRRVGRLARPNR
ncbi:hypothetical protein AB0P21_18535 [Kribbella sp. NPDC056861]|uniref:hypothetical protein n=1 Tax=Kribbella sp. NPDC056861 TaxID=3154857 RepID=UPI0034212EF9